MNSAELFKTTGTSILHSNIKSSEADLLSIVKQVCELTGCSNDLAVTALFDSNYKIEVAVDKIFEQTQKSFKLNDDWKEVPKSKRKPNAVETNINELNNEILKENGDNNNKVFEKSKVYRGRGRGRGSRLTKTTDSFNCRSYANKDENEPVESSDIYKSTAYRGSRGRKTPFKNQANRGRLRLQHYNHDSGSCSDPHVDDYDSNRVSDDINKWNANDEWLSDDTGGKSVDNHGECEKPMTKTDEWYQDDDDISAVSCDKFDGLTIQCSGDEKLPQDVVKDNSITTATTKADSISTATTTIAAAAELVAKSCNKNDIFGDWSRTKPPPPSSIVPSDPVKLVTAGGIVKSTNKTDFNFSFGLNFSEYSKHQPQPNVCVGGGSSSESFISTIISNKSTTTITIADKSAPSDVNIHSDLVTNNYLNYNIEPSHSQSNAMRISASSSSPSSNNKSKDVVYNNSTSSNNKCSKDADKKVLTSTSSTDPINHHSNSHSHHHQVYKQKTNNPTDISSSGECLNSLNPILSSSSSSQQQLCPPPGMSNANVLHQINTSPHSYFPFLNIPNGSTLYNIAQHQHHIGEFNSDTDDNHHPHNSFENSTGSSNKEFCHKQMKQHQPQNLCNMNIVSSGSGNCNQNQVYLSKVNDSDGSSHASTMLSAAASHIPAVQMPNVCFQPLYNFANFLPATVVSHGTGPSTGQAIDLPTHSSSSTKPPSQMYNVPSTTRTLPPQMQQSDEFDSSKYDDYLHNKQQQSKYRASQNYVPAGYNTKQQQSNDDSVDTETSSSTNCTKQQSRPANSVTNITSTTRTNHQQPPPQQSSDPRYLAFQHSPHTYPGNTYNYVTAPPGSHSQPPPHPYAMAHQAGGLQQIHPQQLHLMQQQMHNFPPPQPYHFQDHMMPSMVSSASNRNNISQQNSASQSNQTRSSRTNNNLWPPTN